MANGLAIGVQNNQVSPKLPVRDQQDTYGRMGSWTVARINEQARSNIRPEAPLLPKEPKEEGARSVPNSCSDITITSLLNSADTSSPDIKSGSDTKQLESAMSALPKTEPTCEKRVRFEDEQEKVNLPPGLDLSNTTACQREHYSRILNMLDTILPDASQQLTPNMMRLFAWKVEELTRSPSWKSARNSIQKPIHAAVAVEDIIEHCFNLKVNLDTSSKMKVYTYTEFLEKLDTKHVAEQVYIKVLQAPLKRMAFRNSNLRTFIQQNACFTYQPLTSQPLTSQQRPFQSRSQQHHQYETML